MRNLNTFCYAIAIVLALVGCKVPSYHFVSPTLNHTALQKGGTGQVGVQLGTVGIGLKGGVALSETVSVNGFLGGLPETKDDYTSREAELSIGIHTGLGDKAITSFFLGMGMGHNEKDITRLDGSYSRPFIQVQRGIYNKKIFEKLYLDASGGVRLNYLFYNGVNEGNNFDHNVFYTEPYVGIAIGRRNLRLEVLQGVAIKMSGTWERNLRIFPYMGNIGLQLKWGR